MKSLHVMPQSRRPTSITVEGLREELHQFQRDIIEFFRGIPAFRFVTIASVRGADMPVLVDVGMPVTDAVLVGAVVHGDPETAIDLGSLHWYPSTDAGKPGVWVKLVGNDIVAETDYDLRVLFLAERT